MAVVHNTFTDPAGVTPAYTWALNHNQESEGGRDRGIDVTQNIAGVRNIQTQGELGALTFTLQGDILDSAQLAAFWAWFALCETQTIYWTDFAGDEYEVLISAFKPVRERVVLNSRQRDKPWKWTYSMTLTVVRVLAGSMAGQPA